MAATRRRVLEIGTTAALLGATGCVEINVGGGGDSNGSGGDDSDGSDDGNDDEVSAPAVHWEYEQREGELLIEHAGGDAVSVDSLRILGPVESVESSADTLSTGHYLTVQLTNDASSGDTIEIVYRDSEGTETVIGEYTLS